MPSKPPAYRNRAVISAAWAKNPVPRRPPSTPTAVPTNRPAKEIGPLVTERDTAWAMSAKDVEAAEASVRLWNTGDRAGFLAAFHPDGQWSSAIKRQVEGGEGLYRGREEIGRFWDEWHAVWDPPNIVFSEARSPRDGWVVAFGGFRATGAGSGVGVEREFGWVFQIEGGLIREASTYLSREEALEAAGLSE